jgi:hypothetical protein
MLGRPAPSAGDGTTRAWRRALHRFAVLGPLLLLVVSVSWSAAGAASAAATIDCTPMGDSACRQLTPVLECSWDNGDGTRTLVWGYDNPTTSTLNIDIGNKNRMSPGAEDQGQPTLFQPGRYANVFVTVVAGTSADGRLGNNTASLGRGTATCAGHQVTMVGDATALALGLAVILSLALPVLTARPRRVAR